MSDDGQDVSMPRTITREDVADDNPAVIARQLRRLSVEIQTSFELVGERLKRIAEAVEHIALKQEDITAEMERLKRPLKAVRSK